MASNPSHSLSPATGTTTGSRPGEQTDFNRPLTIAINVADLVVSGVQTFGGTAVAPTGAGAAVAFHGGLSAAQAFTNLVGSVAMSPAEYQKLQSETKVVSLIGLLVLLAEGIRASSTNTPVNLERAAAIAGLGNDLYSAGRFLSKTTLAVGKSTQYSVGKGIAQGYSAGKGAAKTYSFLGSGSSQSKSNAQSKGQPVSAGAPKSTSSSAIKESRSDRELRERGGTPRIDNRESVRDHQEKQMDRSRYKDPINSGRRYNA